MLLNHQIAFTREALQILEPYHSKKFYGPDGQVGSGSFMPKV
ncbi:MAG: hypothetical protein XXXJIFNMEKO3_01057 [Candidatus Erwinia impunctatus]|nr:hypothetical protein XXXJIFNMEKO_01057 [Culicoides impunctatus]